MKISEIRRMPTSVTAIPDGCSGVHESNTRAYWILEKVKYYWREGVPPKIILELVEEMESGDA